MRITVVGISDEDVTILTNQIRNFLTKDHYLNYEIRQTSPQEMFVTKRDVEHEFLNDHRIKNYLKSVRYSIAMTHPNREISLHELEAIYVKLIHLEDRMQAMEIKPGPIELP